MAKVLKMLGSLADTDRDALPTEMHQRPAELFGGAHLPPELRKQPCGRPGSGGTSCRSSKCRDGRSSLRAIPGSGRKRS